MGWAQEIIGGHEIIMILHHKGLNGLTQDDYKTVGKDLVDVSAVFGMGWAVVGAGATGLRIAIYEQKNSQGRNNILSCLAQLSFKICIFRRYLLEMLHFI